MKKSTKFLTALSLVAAFTLVSSPSFADSLEPETPVAVIETTPIEETPLTTEESTSSPEVSSEVTVETPTEETPTEETKQAPEAKKPKLIQVWEDPPTPQQDAQCQLIDPNLDDNWYYESHYDEVGNTGYFNAYVPKGYQVRDSGAKYWIEVEGGHVFEFECTPAPVLIEVWTTPPTPGQDDQCKLIDPNPNDEWFYESHYDEVGNTGYFNAYVGEGYQVQDSGAKYWFEVEGGHVFEFQCIPTKPAPIPVVVTPPPATQTPADDQPSSVTPVAIEQLAETGSDEDLLILLLTAGGVLFGLGAGAILYTRRIERRNQ